MKKQRRASAIVGGLVVGMVIVALAKELAMDYVEWCNGKYGFAMPCHMHRRHSEPDVKVYPPRYKRHISR